MTRRVRVLSLILAIDSYLQIRLSTNPAAGRYVYSLLLLYRRQIKYDHATRSYISTLLLRLTRLCSPAKGQSKWMHSLSRELSNVSNLCGAELPQTMYVPTVQAPSVHLQHLGHPRHQIFEVGTLLQVAFRQSVDRSKSSIIRSSFQPKSHEAAIALCRDSLSMLFVDITQISSRLTRSL